MEVNTMATMNISLPDTMRKWVEAQILTGEYANISDYVRDIIRHDQQHREQLKLALISGENSGTSPRLATSLKIQRKN
jgi:antitoxin ParD1/3/4